MSGAERLLKLLKIMLMAWQIVSGWSEQGMRQGRQSGSSSCLALLS